VAVRSWLFKKISNILHFCAKTISATTTKLQKNQLYKNNKTKEKKMEAVT